MAPNTQLLCTFTSIDDLESTLRRIITNYPVCFNTIYVLENVDVEKELCCTYNIDVTKMMGTDVPPSTISLHRKKMTNTLYTINALNHLVAKLNNGRPDKNFQIPWMEYKNTILVTAFSEFKQINTRLYRIVDVSKFGV